MADYDLLARAAAQQRVHGSLAREIAHLKQTIAGYESDQFIRESDLSELTEELEGKNRKLAELGKQLAGKNEELAGMGQENAELKAKLSQVHEHAATQAAPATVDGHAANDDDDHAADPAPALANFAILGDDPAVAALSTGAGDARRASLEAAVEADPTHRASVQAPAEYVAELEAATQTAIGARLAGDGLFKEAFEALQAGNESFYDVYTAVWNVVEIGEPGSLAPYSAAVAAAQARLPPSKPSQKVVTVAELFRDGARAKPGYDAMATKLLAKLRRRKGQRPAVLKLCPTLKKTTRLAEKAAFAGAAAMISDVVRGMLIVKSMAGVRAVLELLEELEGQGLIKIVRIKDRFVGSPSSGGWRDLMVNLIVLDGHGADNAEVAGLEHVCELQVVHEKMLTARGGLPGHAVYDRARNAIELLTKKFGSAVLAQEALALAALHAATGGGGAVETGVGFAASVGSYNPYGANDGYTPHKSGKDLYLEDKGWLSDGAVGEWFGVTTDPTTGRVTAIDLRARGLAGQLPRALACLASLEALDLRTNPQLELPPGLQELGLLDSLTRQVLYTSANDGKVRAQALLAHLARTDAGRASALAEKRLEAQYGPDARALKAVCDAAGGIGAVGKGAWFNETDMRMWHGVTLGQQLEVARLDLSQLESLARLPAEIAGLQSLVSLTLGDQRMHRACTSLTSLPAGLSRLQSLSTLNLSGCSSLTSLPGVSALVAPAGTLQIPDLPDHLAEWKRRGYAAYDFMHDPPPADTTEVDLSEYSGAEPPAHICQLESLSTLNLEGCTSLTSLPADLSGLQSLSTLNLRGCTSLTGAMPDLSARVPPAGRLQYINLPDHLAGWKAGGYAAWSTPP